MVVVGFVVVALVGTKIVLSKKNENGLYGIPTTTDKGNGTEKSKPDQLSLALQKEYYEVIHRFLVGNNRGRHGIVANMRDDDASYKANRMVSISRYIVFYTTQGRNETTFDTTLCFDSVVLRNIDEQQQWQW